MSRKERKKPQSLRRQMTHRYERVRGKRRLHRTLEEKLRKYEGRPEAQEWIPLLMHLLARYVDPGLSERNLTPVDLALAEALDKIPAAREIATKAVEVHAKIPYEVKRRVFSPKYLAWPKEQPPERDEVARVLTRALHLAEPVFVPRRPPLPYPVGGWKVSPMSIPLPPREEDTTRCCCCCWAGTAPPPPPPTPPPKPPNKYEVLFSHLYCVDESDPEWGGSDEPYVVFAVITEEMAEQGVPAWGVRTPVYEDVDDGDRRPEVGEENLRLFGYTGPRPINSSVLISATCIEHDGGDVSQTTDAVRTALTAAAKAGVAAGGEVGWIVAGVSVLAIGVSYLIDLVAEDDQIGQSIALSLTEEVADQLTDGVNPHVFPPLHFDGGDDDGIYDVYLKLVRR